MIDIKLFLGFPIQDTLLTRLNSISKDEYIRFLGPESEYLISVKGPEGIYIGKKLDSLIDREALQNAEANVYSLLTKLIPDFPFKSSSLILFPYHE